MFPGRSQTPDSLNSGSSGVTVSCELSHQAPLQHHGFMRTYGAPSLGFRWETAAPSLTWRVGAIPQSSTPFRRPRNPHSPSLAKPRRGSSFESPLSRSYRDGLVPHFRIQRYLPSSVLNFVALIRIKKNLILLLCIISLTH